MKRLSGWKKEGEGGVYSACLFKGLEKKERKE